MDTNRVINIVIAELGVENLKLQERLETAINSNEDIDSKVLRITSALSTLVTNELMLEKFTTMINKTTPELKNKENGEI